MARRIGTVLVISVVTLVAWSGSGLAAQDQGEQAAAAKPKTEKVSGYAEWRRGDALIVDGQRVVADTFTKLKGKGITSFDAIPLGYELEAKGTRLASGALLAAEIEAKGNGTGLFENDIQSATSDMEAHWLQTGAITEDAGEGKQRVVGKILESGPAVDRVRRILKRVTPPYIPAEALRIHVVDTKDWNAMAMGNGAMWVFTGLLNDLNDDEVAMVLGHELAHYTHEHSRREFKRAFWTQLIAAGALATAEAMTKDEKKKAAVAVAAMATIMIRQNGYSRELEDQADRVGMRYAYEGGFDVAKGPALWVRFREKYGEPNGLVNFFLGDHSRATDRVKRLTREIELNYVTGPR